MIIIFLMIGALFCAVITSTYSGSIMPLLFIVIAILLGIHESRGE